LRALATMADVFNPDLTVVIPVLNERENLPRSPRLDVVLGQLDCASEVLVVDGGLP